MSKRALILAGAALLLVILLPTVLAMTWGRSLEPEAAVASAPLPIPTATAAAETPSPATPPTSSATVPPVSIAAAPPVAAPTTTPAPVPAAAGDSVRGREIFMTVGCTGCHPGGQALVGPSLFGVTKRLPEARIRDQIGNGGTIMPPLGSVVGEEDITNLIAFLRTLE